MIIILLAIILTIISLVLMENESYSKALVFGVLSTVAWFVVAILWLISSQTYIVSILFLGIGVFMTVSTIADALEVLRMSAEQKEEGD